MWDVQESNLSQLANLHYDRDKILKNSRSQPCTSQATPLIHYSCLTTRPFIVTLLTLIGDASIYTFMGLYAGKANVATV